MSRSSDNEFNIDEIRQLASQITREQLISTTKIAQLLRQAIDTQQPAVVWLLVTKLTRDDLVSAGARECLVTAIDRRSTSTALMLANHLHRADLLAVGLNQIERLIALTLNRNCLSNVSLILSKLETDDLAQMNLRKLFVKALKVGHDYNATVLCHRLSPTDLQALDLTKISHWTNRANLLLTAEAVQTKLALD